MTTTNEQHNVERVERHTHNVACDRKHANHIMSNDVTKRIVDRVDAQIVQNEINDLLLQLKNATKLNDKKRIRRKLRTREYYISRQNTSNVVDVMTTQNVDIVENANDASIEKIDVVATIVDKSKKSKSKKSKSKSK